MSGERVSPPKDWTLTDEYGRLRESLLRASDPLDRIGAYLELSKLWNAYLYELVSDAREAGHSWSDIARTMGVSRQAVHQRFASPDEHFRDTLEEIRAQLSLSGPGGVGYQALVEHLPCLVYVTSLDQRAPHYVNPLWESVTGYTQKDFLDDPKLGKTFIHPDDIEDAVSAWYDSIRSANQFSARFRLRKKDGGYIWVRDLADVIVDDQGDTKAILGFVFDFPTADTAAASF